jgi:hypothetical protein
VFKEANPCKSPFVKMPYNYKVLEKPGITCQAKHSNKSIEAFLTGKHQ